MPSFFLTNNRLSVIDESSFLSHSDISYDRTDDDLVTLSEYQFDSVHYACHVVCHVQSSAQCFWVCRIWTVLLLWSLWSRDLGRKEWASFALSVCTGLHVQMKWIWSSMVSVFSARPWGRWSGFRYRNAGESVGDLEICSVWDPRRRFLRFLCYISLLNLENSKIMAMVRNGRMLGIDALCAECVIRRWRGRWWRRRSRPLIMVVRSTWWLISLRRHRSQSEPELISSLQWAVRLDYIITDDDIIAFSNRKPHL